jgi:hypothetical protein
MLASFSKKIHSTEHPSRYKYRYDQNPILALVFMHFREKHPLRAHLPLMGSSQKPDGPIVVCMSRYAFFRKDRYSGVNASLMMPGYLKIGLPPG